MTDKNFKQRIFHFEQPLIKETSWTVWVFVKTLVRFCFSVIVMILKVFFKILGFVLRIVFSPEVIKKAHIESELENAHSRHNFDPLYHPDNPNNPARKELENRFF